MKVKTWQERAELAIDWPCFSGDQAAPHMKAEIAELRAALEPSPLKLKHDEYIAKCRAAGDKLVAYRVPCCGGLLETRAAPRGEVWDTVSQCPHCGHLYIKLTRGSEIEALSMEIK
jgi:hypothetical protein